MSQPTSTSAAPAPGAHAGRIAAGHAASGAAPQVGAVVLRDAAHPGTRIRVPLSMNTMPGSPAVTSIAGSAGNTPDREVVPGPFVTRKR